MGNTENKLLLLWYKYAAAPPSKALLAVIAAGIKNDFCVAFVAIDLRNAPDATFADLNVILGRKAAIFN